MAPGLVLFAVMLIAKVKSVCYNHFVGRRALPVVASRFCYRRREGCVMTTYESMMERILSRNILFITKRLTFSFKK